jgi:hypothetical protein
MEVMKRGEGSINEEFMGSGDDGSEERGQGGEKMNCMWESLAIRNKLGLNMDLEQGRISIICIYERYAR